MKDNLDLFESIARKSRLVFTMSHAVWQQVMVRRAYPKCFINYDRANTKSGP